MAGRARPRCAGQAVALGVEPPACGRGLAPAGFHPSRNTVGPAMPAWITRAALPVAGDRGPWCWPTLSHAFGLDLNFGSYFDQVLHRRPSQENSYGNPSMRPHGVPAATETRILRA